MERLKPKSRLEDVELKELFDFRILNRASRCHHAQHRVMNAYMRGWSEKLVLVDNTARGLLFLPEYSYQHSPSRGYIELVNGSESTFEAICERVEEQFRPMRADAFRDRIMGHVAVENQLSSRERYVPPVEFTYVAFRLDGQAIKDFPIRDFDSLGAL